MRQAAASHGELDRALGPQRVSTLGVGVKREGDIVVAICRRAAQGRVQRAFDQCRLGDSCEGDAAANHSDGDQRHGEEGLSRHPVPPHMSLHGAPFEPPSAVFAAPFVRTTRLSPGHLCASAPCCGAAVDPAWAFPNPIMAAKPNSLEPDGKLS
jgi:hypothetical protein